VPNPLVSVVVASYNGERFLAETLDSVFAQEYDPYEVVFVDDGSTDATAEIAQRYPLCYVVRENGGLAAARNTGIAECRGEYVTFLDDDDMMPRDRLALQARRLAQQPELGCVLGRQEWLNAPDWLPRDPVFGDPAGIPLAAAMVRRDVLDLVGGFDESFRYAEDRDLLVRLREHEVGIDVLSEVVLLRRYHGENMTAPENRPDVHPLTRSLKAKLDRQRNPKGAAT
jgi:glycosyltransferase involved in cell wall biosynthesis